MGVIGLTTFIDDHKFLLSDLKLHDTKLVIDGSNLAHFIYHYFNVAIHYGGDYDIYASVTRYYFKALQKCGIQPFVVFDGAYEKDHRKMRTVLERTKSRIVAATRLARGGYGRLAPVLVIETFRQVLTELKVPHVTCDFEADAHLISLANQWNCPVLSNDSDFFVFDCKAGFVLLDYLDLKVCDSSKDDKHDSTHENEQPTNTSPYKYINVQIFYLDNFTSHYKIKDRSHVVLLAILLGNDFIKGTRMKNFISRLNCPTPSRRNHLTQKGAKLVGVLNWLETVDTVECAIEEICLMSGDSESLRTIIKKVVDMYHTGSDALSAFFEKGERIECSLRSLKENPFPTHLQTSFQQGLLPRFALNVIQTHQNIIQCQVEAMDKPSSHACALKLRRILYSFLVSLDTQGSSECRIKEYERRHRTLEMHYTSAMDTLPNGDHVPPMLTIDEMDVSKRYAILMNILEANITNDDNTTGFLPVFVAAIRFWIRHSSSKLLMDHVIVILTSFIKLMLIDTRDISKSEVDPASYLSDSCEKYNFTTAEKVAATKRLKLFTKVPQHPGSRHFNSAVVHMFAEFQAVMLMVYSLNAALALPVNLPQMHLIYNGTFIYNLMYELSLRSDPRAYVGELLGVKTSLKEFFVDLLCQICTDIPERCSLEHALKSRKVRSRRKKKSKQNASATHTKVLTDKSSDSESEEVGDSVVQASCSLANKFSGLCL